MMQNGLLAEGLALMLVGMGAVFALLALLVAATQVLRWLVQDVAGKQEAATLEELAAIAAAVHRHRNSRNR